MFRSQPQPHNPRSNKFNHVIWTHFLFFLLAALLSSPLQAQMTAASPASPASCPVQFLRFVPSGVYARVKNVSGKSIVGLNFNAAIADATEHWKWLHWQFSDALPLRDFGWNKQIKADAAKTLSWDRAYLDFWHGGGGAFVLTDVLFEDGSTWQESPGGASCKYVWHNNHKKSFIHPVILPLRQ
jgi:hypothetical protein